MQRFSFSVLEAHYEFASFPESVYRCFFSSPRPFFTSPFGAQRFALLLFFLPWLRRTHPAFLLGKIYWLLFILYSVDLFLLPPSL